MIIGKYMYSRKQINIYKLQLLNSTMTLKENGQLKYLAEKSLDLI